MATIFSKIVNGEIPCHKIAENREFFAFLDIHPLVEGHTLVIPKEEIDYIFDIQKDCMCTETGDPLQTHRNDGHRAGSAACTHSSGAYAEGIRHALREGEARTDIRAVSRSGYTNPLEAERSITPLPKISLRPPARREENLKIVKDCINTLIADLLKTFPAFFVKKLLAISYLCTRKRFPRCPTQQGMKMGIRCKSGTIPVAVSSAICGRRYLWPLLPSATEREGATSGTSQKTCRDTRNKNL